MVVSLGSIFLSAMFINGNSTVPTKKRKQSAQSGPKMTRQEQHARFVEAAKKAEADEAPNAMDKAVKRLDLRKKEPSDASG